jgi:hypothetical protein
LFDFLLALIERVGKPLVVILDTSIHTAKKLKPYWDLSAEKGMRLYCGYPTVPSRAGLSA